MSCVIFLLLCSSRPNIYHFLCGCKKITYKCSKEIYECIDMHYILQCLIHFYYIDTSVLLENIPLVKFLKTTSGTRVVYFPRSHTWVYRWRNFGNLPSKFVGVLRLLNFTSTFFKALRIFCHCRALFSSVLFLKIMVTTMSYSSTVNLSRRNYFLANKNFYWCLFVYIIKRTLHGGLKIWILFSRGKNNILLTRCALS